MSRNPALLVVFVTTILQTACSDSSDSRWQRAIAALSGDTRTESTLYFTKNINLLQRLHSTNADMRWQLVDIWKGKTNQLETLQDNIESATQALQELDTVTQNCGQTPDTTPYREAIVLLDQTWKQQLVDSQLSIDASKDLKLAREQLRRILKQAHQFTDAIIDSTAKMVEFRPSKENATVSYYLSYILSKSAELEQRMQYLLSTNVMNADQIKMIMRSRTNITRILSGMFRGDKSANIKIVHEKKRRKIISALQKQFAEQDYIALATAYDTLLDQQISEASTRVDFELTQQIIDKTVELSNTLIENGYSCT
ncbi:MAG: hypothetical protein ACC707_10815 [Thiohalomonadales bacterium]